MSLSRIRTQRKSLTKATVGCVLFSLWAGGSTNSLYGQKIVIAPKEARVSQEEKGFPNRYIFCETEEGASFVFSLDNGAEADFLLSPMSASPPPYHFQTDTAKSQGATTRFSHSVKVIKNAFRGNAFRIEAALSGGERIADTFWVFFQGRIGQPINLSVDSLRCDKYYLSATPFSLPVDSFSYFHPNTPTIVDKIKATTAEGRAQWGWGGLLSSLSIGYNLDKKWDPPKNAYDTVRAMFSVAAFGCPTDTTIKFVDSFSTVAQIETETEQGEAGAELEVPSDVLFKSENSVAAQKFLWKLYKSNDEVKRLRESYENTGRPLTGARDTFLFSVEYDQPTPVSMRYKGSGDYLVELITYSAKQCMDTTSKTIKLKKFKIEVSNHFTPNGDGTRDKFKIAVTSVKSIDLVIFNQWGQEVYRYQADYLSRLPLSDFTPIQEELWDGTVNGNKASEGVYYYQIIAVSYDGETEESSGFIHLFR